MKGPVRLGKKGIRWSKKGHINGEMDRNDRRDLKLERERTAKKRFGNDGTDVSMRQEIDKEASCMSVRRVAGRCNDEIDRGVG